MDDIKSRLRKAADDFEAMRRHAANMIDSDCEPHWSEQTEMQEASITAVEAAAYIERLEAAIEPFAKVGDIIDGPFGPALFRGEDDAFQSGCAWTENGERKTLTWGDFRRAREVRTIKDAIHDGE